MRTLSLLLVCCMLTMGCTSGNPPAPSRPPSQATAQPGQVEQQQEKSSPAVQPDKGKGQVEKEMKGKPGKAKGKTEDEIRAELEETALKLVSQASKTLLPSKRSMKHSVEGKEHVANYAEIDKISVTTEMRPGTAPGHYTGIIRYRETLMECRGPDKKSAMAAKCRQVAGRNISELILYDGNRWVY
jgi:hypothetical protein